MFQVVIIEGPVLVINFDGVLSQFFKRTMKHGALFPFRFVVWGQGGCPHLGDITLSPRLTLSCETRGADCTAARSRLFSPPLWPRRSRGITRVSGMSLRLQRSVVGYNSAAN